MEGKRLKVVAREPAGGPIVVKTGNTTLTIGRGMAHKILVGDGK
jgi:Fe2+ transport system protein FeoA